MWHRGCVRLAISQAAMLIALLAVAWPNGPRAVHAAGRVIVADARVGLHDTETRVVLDLSNTVEFSFFTLVEPYRIVIDLTQVLWTLPSREISVNRGVLERIRYGLFRPGTSRVVLDCTGPAQVKEALLIRTVDGRGYRLVLDLIAVSDPAFRSKARNGRLAPGLKQTGLPMVPGPRKPRRPSQRRVIVIDPGHGGIDPGAISVSGVHEKEVTLAAARQIRDELERIGRYDVVLTRERDDFIRLRDRIALARKAGADMFISIHADANPKTSVRGASVYTLSEKASDAEAAALAERENKADLITGVDLTHESPEVTNILIDLAQRETMIQSVRLASFVVRELGRETALLRNTHRFAGFAVLKAPDVPSILVELGHLSNSRDENLLRRPDYRGKLARAIARAIDGYFVGVEEARRQ